MRSRKPLLEERQILQNVQLFQLVAVRSAQIRGFPEDFDEFLH